MVMRERASAAVSACESVWCELLRTLTLGGVASLGSTARLADRRAMRSSMGGTVASTVCAIHTQVRPNRLHAFDVERALSLMATVAPCSVPTPDIVPKKLSSGATSL